MKHQQCRLLGNGLMCVGLMVMVSGVGYSIISQLPAVNWPQFLAQGAMFAIFIGALMWLVGARVSGRERVEDRYYWLRHYGDKRCRRHHHGSH